MVEWLTMHAWWVFLAVSVGSFLLTWIIRAIALRFRVLDHPDVPGTGRKKHVHSTPLLGGVAIYLLFSATLLVALFVLPSFTAGYLLPKHVLGLIVGGGILILGGVLDDILDLSPKVQIVFPVLSALTVVASGVGLSFLTNPFGTGLDLTTVQFQVFSWGGIPYFFVLFADVFAFLWILVSIYATKFLDGVDGLVSGITVISGLVLFALSVQPEVGQPETAFIAFVLSAATLGFLVWNLPLPRARIFLGEGGSTFLGFVLAVLAILSGAKLATALLLLGLPFVDVALVIARRLLARQSPFVGDRRHLHYLLLRFFSGSVWKTLLVLWGLVLLFGLLALVLDGRAKAILFLVLVFVVVLSSSVLYLSRRGT